MDIQQLPGNTLLIVAASDLQAFAESLIRDKTQAPAAPVVVEDNPLTAKEAAAFLKVSRPTFIRYRKTGKIAGHVLGGKVLFFKSELLKSIKTGM